MHCYALFWLNYFFHSYLELLYKILHTIVTRLSNFTKYNTKTFFNYVVHLISFQTFFVQEFKIVVDFWKFSILLLYILLDDWLIFMISSSNEHLQQEFQYPTKAWLSQLVNFKNAIWSWGRMICNKILF